MQVGGKTDSNSGASVLLVDSDTRFLRHSCKIIAEDGHQAWAAEDLLAAANFLVDHRPDVLVIELDLLEADEADPLQDLQARAPGAATVLADHGPPEDRFRRLWEHHEIYGYLDKGHGTDSLRLWVSAALTRSRQAQMISRTRTGLRRIVEAVPDFHRIQSLDDVLESILSHTGALADSSSAFIAARMSDPVGKPPIEGFEELSQAIDDYVVGASNTETYQRGTSVAKLASVPGHLLRRAIDERSNVLDDHHGVVPLALAQHVLGIAYLEQPRAGVRDTDLLRIFGSQAAAAIRNAVLYELATIDSTTRVFQKSFTLERLRQTIKLAWRKAFSVSVLMLDINRFKELNDKHGHVAGDRALRQLGAALKENVRDSDIVGRFGGDEFLVVLIDADSAGAKIVVDRLHAMSTSTSLQPLPSNSVPLSLTMGMATLRPEDTPPIELGFPDFSAVVETLVGEADAAMYRARQEGVLRSYGRLLSWADFLE
ncbi:MAG: diguanylate cyclase [Gemmatimonadota bacterium]|nr:MAG: diguanylate cyclase [Gemmatimonadota bacterium]